MNNSRKDSMYISNAVHFLLYRKHCWIQSFKPTSLSLFSPPFLSYSLMLAVGLAMVSRLPLLIFLPGLATAEIKVWATKLGLNFSSVEKYFTISMKLAIFYHCCRELGVLEENLFSDFRVCFSSPMALDKDSSPLPTSVCLHCIMTYIHTNGSPSV